jgi:hypothetical protein
MGLSATGTVRRHHARELLDRRMPVEGQSLFQVLAAHYTFDLPSSSTLYNLSSLRP